MRLPRKRFRILSNRLSMSFLSRVEGRKESIGCRLDNAFFRIRSNFSGKKWLVLKRFRISSTVGPSTGSGTLVSDCHFVSLRGTKQSRWVGPSTNSGTSVVAARHARTSSTVPTHSKGFTGAVPFNSSKIGCKLVSAIKSLPKIAVSFSRERKGDRIIHVNKHLGQWPHHESVLLPTLQLRNTGW